MTVSFCWIEVHFLDGTDNRFVGGGAGILFFGVYNKGKLIQIAVQPLYIYNMSNMTEKQITLYMIMKRQFS